MSQNQDSQLVVRLSQSLMDRIDAHGERLRHEQPGPAWRRADVVRMLLIRALDEVEKKPKRGGR